MEHSVPPHWVKGTLLDLKRFGDGSYKATLLGDDDNPKTGYIAPAVHFDSSFEAQNFVSQWYTRESVGGVHG